MEGKKMKSWSWGELNKQTAKKFRVYEKKKNALYA